MKQLKTAIGCVLSALSLFLLFYAIAAFAEAELDFPLWPETVRRILGYAGGFVALLMSAIGWYGPHSK